MTKRKLKDWVLPALGLIVLIGALLTYVLISNIINSELTLEDNYFVDVLKEDKNIIEVNKEIETTSIKPFTSKEVKISKHFYNKNDDTTKQQESLIKYENIYMPNTGILYGSDKEFDVVASLDGKVISVKQDEILGNIIEIEHTNNIVTIYQSVKDVKVSIGDQVKQGELIAKSGSNKLSNEKENCLHFEVYKEGSLLNPEEFYNLKLS